MADFIATVRAASLAFREPTSEDDRQRIGRAVFRALGLHVDPLPPPPRSRGRYLVGLSHALKEPKKA